MDATAMGIASLRPTWFDIGNATRSRRADTGVVRAGSCQAAHAVASVRPEQRRGAGFAAQHAPRATRGTGAVKWHDPPGDRSRGIVSRGDRPLGGSSSRVARGRDVPRSGARLHARPLDRRDARRARSRLVRDPPSTADEVLKWAHWRRLCIRLSSGTTGRRTGRARLLICRGLTATTVGYARLRPRARGGLAARDRREGDRAKARYERGRGVPSASSGRSPPSNKVRKPARRSPGVWSADVRAGGGDPVRRYTKRGKIRWI